MNNIKHEVTCIATCWKLKLRSGDVKAFTDHDVNLIIDDIIYYTNDGFTHSAIVSNSSISVDNLEIEGILSNDLIKEQDLLNGVYDFAEVEIFMVDYHNTKDRLHLKRGWFGEIIVRDGKFTVEVRGMTNALNQTIGELYSPTCRASLGDGRCKVDIEKYKFTGIVSAIVGADSFVDDFIVGPINYFKYGHITFEGITHTYEIKESNHGKIILTQQLPYSVNEGSKYTIYAGCDKAFNTCKCKFANVLNFRGEPHLPGINKLLAGK